MLQGVSVKRRLGVGVGAGVGARVGVGVGVSFFVVVVVVFLIDFFEEYHYKKCFDSCFVSIWFVLCDFWFLKWNLSLLRSRSVFRVVGEERCVTTLSKNAGVGDQLNINFDFVKKKPVWFISLHFWFPKCVHFFSNRFLISKNFSVWFLKRSV